MHSQWTENDPYDKEFDLSGLESLYDFASLAFRECNLGNDSDWYGHFLGGYMGLRARLYGVRVHYYQLHAWTPHRRDTEEMDYHLATILFGMDSAVECCTYALNALGCALAPAEFHNVGDDAALRRIRPDNIIGKPADPPQREVLPLPGYATLFPKVQQYWQQQRRLLNEIMAQHDASKHRMATILDSSTWRDDPPAGFFDELDIPTELDKQEYIPRANFYLMSGVKEPNARIEAGKGATVFYLEQVMEQFRTFMQKTGELAYQDAQDNIALPHDNILTVQAALYAKRGKE